MGGGAASVGDHGAGLRGRAVVLAGGSRGAAQRAARALGLEDPIILGPADIRALLARGLRLSRASVVIVHTADWRRQSTPQLYLAVAAMLRADSRWIADDARGTLRRVARGRATLQAAACVVDVLGGAGSVALEGVRVVREAHAGATALRGGGHERTLLAVWLGSSEQVGGSVTHMSGILGGFRKLGYTIGLVTATPPPEQLRDVSDELVVADALPVGVRRVTLWERVAVNAAVRRSAASLAARMHPSFVYQRHAAFLGAGAPAAAHVPFVLEWNASEAWARKHWKRQGFGERALRPLLVEIEQGVAARATVVAAVSTHAARMAVAAGADPASILISPNAVDVDEVEAALSGPAVPRDRPVLTLGWVGSFGPWHGAEVLVRALPMLGGTRAVMIGAGSERERCESVARTLGVHDRIDWLGVLPHREALRRLAGTDILVSPHVPLNDGIPFFGSPTKLFEYMGIGRPIVASRLEQLAEVLEHGRTAWLVKPGDAEALAAGIRTVAALPDGGYELGRVARQEAGAKHTWTIRAAAIVEALAPATA